MKPVPRSVNLALAGLFKHPLRPDVTIDPQFQRRCNGASPTRAAATGQAFYEFERHCERSDSRAASLSSARSKADCSEG